MVSSIGNSSAGLESAGAQQIRSQMADRMMKTADSNQDGKITSEELTKAVDASGNKQGLTAAEVFQQLDQGGKGYLTKQDIESGLESAASGQSTPSVPSPGGRGGPPGGGGPPPVGKGDSDSDSSSSTGTSASSSTIYDPEDLNQDGTVSSQEKMQYLLNQYTAQSLESPSLQTFQVEG